MAKPFLISNTPITIFDNSGLIVNGGQLFTYTAGTTTKLTTYPTQADAIAGTNPNSNPLIASSSGRVGQVWATQAAKIVATTATDSDPPVASYWTMDNITSLAQTITCQLKTSNYTVTTSDRDSLIKVDASSGPVTIILPSSASAGNGFNIKFQKIDSSSNAVTIQCYSAELWNGSNTVVLYNQYNYVEGDNDSTQWIQTGSFNVPVSPLSMFLGPELVFAKSAGTWTMTRNAQSNYSYLHTTGDDTGILAVDITNHININSNKGFKLTAFDVCYSIGTGALDAHTVTLDKVSMTNNAAVTVSAQTLTG